MIIVQIKGGLGNQLFSYAAAYGIAKENQTELILDRYIYDTSYVLRRYMLNDFPMINNEFVIKNAPFKNKISQIIYKTSRKVKLNYKYNVNIVLEDEEFKYQSIKINSENIYLNGYWQNYNYFNKYKKDIVEMFQPNIELSERDETLLSKIQRSNSVAVHVRRGDYVKFKGGKCLSESYYMEAIQYIKSNRGEDCIYYIFTDDVEYCKDIFKGIKNVKFIAEESSLDDLEEFYLMSKCKDIIMANSSFSWWAAYLSNCNEKIVIAPVVDMWTEEFYLPEWVKLKSELQSNSI